MKIYDFYASLFPYYRGLHLVNRYINIISYSNRGDVLLGAICGDIIGSVYERKPIKSKRFDLFDKKCCFTDDSVLTVAVADSILNNTKMSDSLKSYFIKYPGAGYGLNFSNWGFSQSSEAYNSWGNGSAMRVSPIGWAFSTEHEVLTKAKISSVCTHNHPEGIKGAKSVANAIFLARNGASKEEIKEKIRERFAYHIDRNLDDIRPDYSFDVSCQGSVPEAIICFLESRDYEDAIRNAISLGGDSDTQAAIAGSIAEAYYGKIPLDISDFCISKLDYGLKSILFIFQDKFCNGRYTDLLMKHMR